MHSERKFTRFLVAPVLIWGFAVSIPSVVAETLKVDEKLSGEIKIVLNGVNSSPNWGLAKIGEQYSNASEYAYPETTQPVRLYLIDTAVKNPSNWITANSKLTFEATVLIGAGASSLFDHGTQMLSLIAGLETGIAPGTPIKVRNYDVYPANVTSAAKIKFAVNDAVAHYQNSHPKIPSVICIASSSNIGASDPSLKTSIESAVAQGLTVIVTAGNQSGYAASYIPAAYGTVNGVICVGASDASNQQISTSNTGLPVDILAPGNNVRTLDSVGSYQLMTGTSPAAALVAGSALAELSMNGSLTPAQVEARLKAAAAPSATPGAPKVLRTTTLSAATIAYPDGPITPTPTALARANFPVPVSPASGEDPTEANGSPAAPNNQPLLVFHGVDHVSDASTSVSYLPEQVIEFSFPVDFELFKPSELFTLSNGLSWRIRCSENLDSWEVPEGTLSKTTERNGTVWLTARIPASAPSCFLRIEVADTE